MKRVLLTMLSIFALSAMLQAELVEKIVFSSDKNGNYDIWMMNPDGSGIQQLTNESSDENKPAISPDGKKIAYITYNNREIWIMDCDGRNKYQVVTDKQAGYNIAWYSDSKHILFNHNPYAKLYKININTFEEELIHNEPFRWCYVIDISSNDSLIVYNWDPINWTPSMEILLLNLHTNETTTLLANDGHRDFWSTFSPDNDKILWLKDPDTEVNNFGMDIWLMSTDGENMRCISSAYTDTLEFWNATFSSQGNHIVAAVKNVNTFQWSLKVLDTTGVILHTIYEADSGAVISNPDWGYVNIHDDGLIAFYPFNGNANDESGNGNDGTVNGATLTTDRFGNENSA
jgi:Tol biopolymer transport system component